jgi:hypothetical protein
MDVRNSTTWLGYSPWTASTSYTNVCIPAIRSDAAGFEEDEFVILAECALLAMCSAVYK